MSRKCEITHKKPVKACRLSKRGIAKKNKGIGLNILKRSRRRQCPNLLKQKFWCTETNRFIKLKTSAHGLRKINRNGINKILKISEKKKYKRSESQPEKTKVLTHSSK